MLDPYLIKHLRESEKYNSFSERTQAILDEVYKAYWDPDWLDSRPERKLNDMFWSMMDNSAPTDHVILPDNETQNRLQVYWRPPAEKMKRAVPADLVLTRTVPIRDLVFTYHFVEPVKKMDVRVCMFDEPIAITDGGDDFLCEISGGIELYWVANPDKKKKHMGIPIFAAPERNHLSATLFAIRGADTWEHPFGISGQTVYSFAREILLVWYGIQLSLLNPITERVIVRKQSKPESTRKVVVNPRGGKKARKIVYIRKYIIRENDIMQPIREKRKTRCPFWYVIGHYRHYKSGKCIFIKGFWKGVDRDKIKNSPEEIRQRLLDMRTVK